MLELIVLGHIPGTNIYLSFESVAIIVAGFILIVGMMELARYEWRAQLKDIQAKHALIFARTI